MNRQQEKRWMNTAWTGEMGRRARERKWVETSRRETIKEHGQKKRDEERWTDKPAWDSERRHRRECTYGTVCLVFVL